MFTRKQLIIFWDLIVRDLKSNYLGSYLSLAWAFIQPAITIAIFWFIFEVGFRAGPQQGKPYVLWLLCGIIPWFFVSESWSRATSAIVSHRFLVKNVVYPLGILPIIAITSALLIHLFFICVIIAFLLAYGYGFSLSYLYVLYYTVCAFVLVAGLSLITSSLLVFISDIGYVVGTLLQFGFWFTPIMWSVNMIPERYAFVAEFNPAFYIINGYRDVLLYDAGIAQGWGMTLYFWVIALLLLALGWSSFKKLKPHFADVL